MFLGTIPPPMINICYINEKEIMYKSQPNTTQSTSIDEVFYVSHISATQFVNEIYSKGNNMSVNAANCDTIKNITAYDLIDNKLIVDYKINGGMIMNELKDISKSSSVNKILRYYNISIKIFSLMIVVLLAMFLFNPFNIPKQALALGVFMFFGGILGMYIDKIRWKEQNKCF